MNITRSSLILIVLMTAFLGCSQQEKKPIVEFISLEEADQKFSELCKRDFNSPVIVKRVPSTLWIYYPIRDDILSLKVSKAVEQINDKRKIIIDPLDIAFEENDFHFSYGITLGNRQLSNPGYGMNYSEEYQQIQRNFMALLQESYFNVASEDAEDMPQFIGIVIADIVTGIEFETIYYFNDLKLTLGPSAYITGEEYLRRTVSDSRGNQEIIGDNLGTHLEYKNITLKEFMIKQIKNRVTYKFTQSDFAPEDDIENELVKIVARVFKIYDFTDYNQSIFYNLDSVSYKPLYQDNAKTITIPQAEMLNQLPEDERSEGKLHVINFLPPEKEQEKISE